MILTAPHNSYFFEEKDKERSSDPGIWFKMFFLFSLCLFFISCASKPEKHFTYEPTANATDEVRNLQAEMSRAEGDQIAVFAPDSYSNAKKSIARAKSLQDKGSSNAKILDELGDARGFFEQAKDTAARSQKALPEVVNSRENALIAGASLYDRKELNEADEKLMDTTKKFEKKNPSISLKDNVDLQSRYQNLELKAIKEARLGDARSKIEGAKKLGAERYAPRSLANAEAKLKSAELSINTDRHNDALITASAAEATHEADKLLKVTDLSKKTGRTGNEGLAIGIVERDERLAMLSQQQQEEAARLKSQEEQMRSEQERMRSQQTRLQQQQAAQLTEAQQAAAAAQHELEARKKIDEAYRQAQSDFKKNEAEVFRQGDNLILRMRGVQFPSGSADVPASAYGTLGKVRDVIQNMNARQVVVEGHTDATGSPQVNQELSQERADAVAQFLRQQVDRRSGASSEINIEAHGYGFEHPITSNKTKKGRALNRRVDIVISPELQTE
jgi:outer membrane protein OmpA-like peptidoglycan-associated protein